MLSLSATTEELGTRKSAAHTSAWTSGRLLDHHQPPPTIAPTPPMRQPANAQDTDVRDVVVEGLVMGHQRR